MLAEDGIQVRAVVRVSMTDQHCIEARCVGGREGRGHPIPGIDQDAEAVRLNDVSAARTPTTGVSATASDDD
jgi:hypothetical protein